MAGLHSGKPSRILIFKGKFKKEPQADWPGVKSTKGGGGGDSLQTIDFFAALQSFLNIRSLI
jgi:hypothetical protein